MAALQSRDKRLAKAKREQQEMHKQQLAAVPAPLVKASHHKANHLSLKDQSLLKIAEREQTKENKDALKAKKVDEAAEKVRAQQQKAKLAAKKVSHAKHAQHATAMAAHKAPTAKHNWGGFLPVHKAKAGLDARAMRLLKSATADQEHDMKAGKAARARDQQAFNKLNGGNIDTGKVLLHKACRARPSRCTLCRVSAGERCCSAVVVHDACVMASAGQESSVCDGGAIKTRCAHALTPGSSGAR